MKENSCSIRRESDLTVVIDEVIDEGIDAGIDATYTNSHSTNHDRGKNSTFCASNETSTANTPMSSPTHNLAGIPGQELMNEAGVLRLGRRI